MSAEMEVIENGVDESVIKVDNAPNKVPKNILDLFYKVVAVKQNVRVDATLSIIRILLKKQSMHDGKSSEICPELQYCIDRLIRGMSSAREAARQGYSVLLSEILRIFPQVELDDVLKLIEKHLAVTNQQEKCPLVIGQLLAYSAIVRSGKLAGSPHVSLVLANLHSLSHDRSYIQEASYKLIAHLFDSLSEKHFKKRVLPHLQSALNSGWEKASADNMYLMLLAIQKFPKFSSEIFLKEHWDNEDLLSENTAHHWRKIIKQSTVVHPRMHPVCYEFLQLCIQEKALIRMWTLVIDDGLFEANQSEKTFLGFLLIKEALNNKSIQKKKIIKTIISPKFSSVLSRCMNPKNPLHSTACIMASYLSDYLKTIDGELQVVVLKPLLQSENTLMLTRRKEVLAMISHLKKEAVIEFCNVLKLIIFENLSKEKDDGDDEDSNSDAEVKDTRQLSAIAQIGVLVSHPSMVSDIEWRRNILNFLFVHSFYVLLKPIDIMPEVFMNKTTESFTPSMRSAFCRYFTNALDSMNLKSTMDQRLETLSSLVACWDCVLENKDCISPLLETNTIEESWRSIRKLSKKLQHFRDNGESSVESKAMQILLLQLGFQLFLDGEKVPPILEELEVCCEKLLSLSVQKPSDSSVMSKSQDEEGLESVGDIPWMQVFVDILLSLLSQPSHHLRCVVHSVFRFISPFLTIETLQLILDVISQKDEGSALMDEDEGSEDEMEIENGDGKKDFGNIEKENSDEKEESDIETGNDDEKDDSDDSDSDEGGAEVDDAFRLKIQNALGAVADFNGNDDEESEIVLSDSEMFKLDDVLSAAFQSRRKVGHTKVTAEQGALMQFKIRCLDLLVCYIKAKPTMNAALKCVKPVFSAYEYGNRNHQFAQLMKSAVNVLKQISLVRKFQDIEGVEKAELIEMLQFLMDKSKVQKMSRDMRKTVFSLCAFIVICEQKLSLNLHPSADENLDSPCVKAYMEALEMFCEDSKCQFSPELFVKLMPFSPAYAWEMLRVLSKKAFSVNKSLYRKKQALYLISCTLQHVKGYKGSTEKMWAKIFSDVVKKCIQELSVGNKSGTMDLKYCSELLKVLIRLNGLFREKFTKNILESHSHLCDVLSTMKQLSKKDKQLRDKLLSLAAGNTNSNKVAESNSKVTDDIQDMEEENDDIQCMEDDNDV